MQKYEIQIKKDITQQYDDKVKQKLSLLVYNIAEVQADDTDEIHGKTSSVVIIAGVS